MYRNNYQRGSFNRYGGGRVPPRGRRVRNFDPTAMISGLCVRETFKEQAITHAFNDFPLAKGLQENIKEKGYVIPTPIQDQAIGPILEGRDLIGIANTGTGKTAAFLIPLIDKVYKDPEQKVLIVTPTRELASQIKEEFLDFSDGSGIYCALAIGGASIGRQIYDLRRYPNFVIGTPGRIQDLIRSRYLDLSTFNSVVLDEADLMVDIGFLQPIKEIISHLSQNRQSLFFSATIDEKVVGILQSFVTNPVTVSVKTRETLANIEQKVVRIDSSQKFEQLHSFLLKSEFEKVLIFGRTKHGVQKLSDELTKRGFRSDAIHGNKNQSQRLRTLDKFKRDFIKILIATDVASRGLDIPNVSHVINYDLPETREAYIHRIGRTGRADKKGVALTFVN